MRTHGFVLLNYLVGYTFKNLKSIRRKQHTNSFELVFLIWSINFSKVLINNRFEYNKF